jgi:hypothetical protein
VNIVGNYTEHTFIFRIHENNLSFTTYYILRKPIPVPNLGNREIDSKRMLLRNSILYQPLLYIFKHASNGTYDVGYS